MLVTLEDVEAYSKLELDCLDEKTKEKEERLLDLLIENAEIYIEDATRPIEQMGEKSKRKAKLLALILVSDFYENRSLNMNINKNMNVSEKVRYTVQSIISQLRLRGDD